METRNLSHPHLGDLLEPELIGGELVGEAGGSGGKLLGHVPNTIRKLKSNKKLCKENNCQTLKSKFTITVWESNVKRSRDVIWKLEEHFDKITDYTTSPGPNQNPASAWIPGTSLGSIHERWRPQGSDRAGKQSSSSDLCSERNLQPVKLVEWATRLDCSLLLLGPEQIIWRCWLLQSVTASDPPTTTMPLPPSQAFGHAMVSHWCTITFSHISKVFRRITTLKKNVATN